MEQSQEMPLDQVGLTNCSQEVANRIHSLAPRWKLFPGNFRNRTDHGCSGPYARGTSHLNYFMHLTHFTKYLSLP
jgi:hypothetical protein